MKGVWLYKCKGCFKVFQQAPFSSATHNRNKVLGSATAFTRPPVPVGRFYKQELSSGPCEGEQGNTQENKALSQVARADPLPRKYKNCSDSLPWCKRCPQKDTFTPAFKNYPACLKQRVIVKGNARSLISSIQVPIHTPPHSQERPVWSRFVQCYPAHKENPSGHLHPSHGCSWGTTGCPPESTNSMYKARL